MARPTAHTALGDAGFKLSDEYSNDGGAVTTRHYTKDTNAVGKGQVVRPITHHVIVHEFGENPGKYNASYYVTQNWQPYADGDFDTTRQHRDNMPKGSKDPIAEIMQHHRGVMGSLVREKAPPLADVDHSNIQRLVNGPFHVTPGWGADDPEMKQPRYIVQGPDRHPLISLNAVEDHPLDPYVFRKLTGGRHGYPKFEYGGRLGGDPDVDVYHASYQDPEDPMAEYGFTIRHNPTLERGFSYNADHHDVTPDENGEAPVGDFLDVTNEPSPVITFSQLGAVIERHHNMLRRLGLLKPRPAQARPAWHFTAAELDSRESSVKKTADEFDDIVGGNGFAGPCWACGKATYNYPEGTSYRDNKSYPMTAEEETGGEMHGPDINLCGTCSQDHGTNSAARSHGSHGSGRIWSYKPDDHDNWENEDDVFKHEAENRAMRLMDQADEDLRP